MSRYGAAALADGFLAIPQVVLRHRRALGITAGEWDYLCELWSYWRCDADPYPSVATLAAGLDVDQSTVRRHRMSLEAKGLLRVYRRGAHQCYDLRSLITAAVERDRVDQAVPGECAFAREHQAFLPQEGAFLRPKEEIEKEDLDLDLTPNPHYSRVEETNAASAITVAPSGEGSAGANFGSVSLHGPKTKESLSPTNRALLAPPEPDHDDEQLAVALAAIGAALHDDAPRSSVTRARNIRAEFQVTPASFLDALDWAAHRVQERAPTIRICTQTGEPNGMPYFFATLRRQLEGRHERPRRGHRARQRPVEEITACGERPADPAPVTEPHPIWRAVLAELRGILTSGNYETWLAATRAIGQEGDVLRVAVPASFNKGWLERKLASRVAQALRAVGHPELQVDYVVEAAASGIGVSCPA